MMIDRSFNFSSVQVEKDLTSNTSRIDLFKSLRYAQVLISLLRTVN